MEFLFHPAHSIIGDILTVILCIPVAALFLFTFLWPLYSAIRDYFGVAEQAPVMPEKSILQSLPLGAPRGGGNYIWDGTAYVPLNEADVDAIRSIMKVAAAAKERAKQNDEEGWEVLAPETSPVAHPDRMLEITNDADGDYDGPDDRPSDDEVERPDERMVFVS